MTAPARHTPHFYSEDEEPACARCGSSMAWEDCSQCGGEGGSHPYEHSPIEYTPDDWDSCSLCLGEGGWWLCLAGAEWCEAHPLVAA